MSGGKQKASTQKKTGKNTRQRSRTEVNRARRRKRHEELHPSDKQDKGVKTGRQLKSTMPAPKKKGKKQSAEAAAT